MIAIANRPPDKIRNGSGKQPGRTDKFNMIAWAPGRSAGGLSLYLKGVKKVPLVPKTVYDHMLRGGLWTF